MTRIKNLSLLESCKLDLGPLQLLSSYPSYDRAVELPEAI